MPLKLTTYYKSSKIPALPENSIFHSTYLFRIYEATPNYTPLLIVATLKGKPIAKMLGVIRKAKRNFPPSIIKRCEVVGTGDFFTTDDEKEELFGVMLKHLTQEALRECFLIEFRNLENALFGYKDFSANHFFAVNWLRVHNSLHDIKSVEDRFSSSRIRQVKKGLKSGAEVYEAQTREEVVVFSKMLHKIYSSRIRKHFPSIAFFRHMDEYLIRQNSGKIFIVKYKEKIIGGSACIYSGETAYLWFSGGMRKTYALQYPGILAVWKALEDAKKNGYRHMEFMDVGLPFKKHGYRDFVLRFGGKQISTRRWFRFRWNWLNRILIKIYR